MSSHLAAIHESGHSVCAFRYGRPLGRALIDGDGGLASTGAIDHQLRGRISERKWNAGCFQEAQICYSGIVSEFIHTGAMTLEMRQAWTADIQHVKDWLALASLRINGARVFNSTRALLSEPRTWRAIHDVADRLLMSGYISGDAIKRICLEHRVPLLRLKGEK